MHRITASIIFESMKRGEAYTKLSDGELASKLMREVWSDLPLFTEKSDLVAEAIERLKKEKEGSCRMNEQVGAIVPAELLARAKEAAK